MCTYISRRIQHASCRQYSNNNQLSLKGEGRAGEGEASYTRQCKNICFLKYSNMLQDFNEPVCLFNSLPPFLGCFLGEGKRLIFRLSIFRQNCSIWSQGNPLAPSCVVQGGVEACYFGVEVARLRDGLAARQCSLIGHGSMMARVRGSVLAR